MWLLFFILFSTPWQAASSTRWRHASPVCRKLREQQAVTGAASRLLTWKQVKFKYNTVAKWSQTISYGNMDEDVLTTLKLLIIGESGVGKSRFVPVCSERLASLLWVLIFLLCKFISRCSAAVAIASWECCRPHFFQFRLNTYCYQADS